MVAYDSSQKGSVLGQITWIIGVRPSRSDLIQIVQDRQWTVLTRNERRLKTALVTKIESLRGTLLQELETPAGVAALQNTYRAIIRRAREAATEVRPPTPMPTIATIAFYLNGPAPIPH